MWDMRYCLFIILASFLYTSSVQARGASEDNPPKDYTFEKFAKQFGKKYKDDGERENRRKIFNQRLKEIRKLNKESNGETTYGVNDHSDWSLEEFQKINTLNSVSLPEGDDDAPPPSSSGGSIPSVYDLRSQGIITTPKHQSTCGSCWAYSAASVYEMYLLRDQGITRDLSQQYLLQCTSPWNCSGGWGNDALVQASYYGMPPQAAYPYKNAYNYYADSLICDPSKSTFYKIQGNTSAMTFGRINRLSGTPYSKTSIQQLIMDNKGVMVTVDASSSNFQNYRSGTLSCPNGYFTHEVHLVGWTSTQWIIKNSWGRYWGLNGYAYINQNTNYDCQLSRFIEYSYISLGGVGSAPPPAPQNLNTDYYVELTDSEDNGWGANTIAINQEGQDSVILGLPSEEDSFATQVLSLVVGRKAKVGVSVISSGTAEIGFIIRDGATNQVVCERKPGYRYSSSMIFCEFCPGCQESLEFVQAQYTLYAAKQGNKYYGYEGTELGFLQNGELIEVGSQFPTGNSQYGPISARWQDGVTVQVVVLSVSASTDTSKQGYSISYQNGDILSEKKGGNKYEEFSLGVFDSFMPTVSASEHLLSENCQRVVVSSSGAPEGTQSTKIDDPLSEDERTGFVAAVSIISTLLLVFIVLSVYLLINKHRLDAKNNHGGSLPSMASSIDFTKANSKM